VSAPRYRFFAGKGGVGKTTCAAAFALGRAAAGVRTLVVSVDPAHSLGDALAVRLSGSPWQVRGRLFAAELDADRALSRWLEARERAFRAIAARGTYLDDEDIDAVLRLALPGVDELVGLIELRRLARGFDEVVVDTAPTGHALRLLQMPETLARLADVLDDLQAKHRAMAEALRGQARRDAEDEVIADLSREARELHDLLRSPAVEFHQVFLAEELPFLEAMDGVAALRQAGMPVARLVANRLTAPPRGRCALCDGRRSAEAAVLRKAQRLGLPLVGVRAAEGEPRGLAALGRLSRELIAGRRLAPAASPRAPAPRIAATRPALRADELLWPEGLRLLFFGGKGGVGKSTAAASAALRAAASGRRVLLLSTDPAHSLGDVLREELGDDERQLSPTLFARELDAPAGFCARRARYREAIDELFATLRGGSSFDAPFDRAVMEDLIDLSPPGLDEIFALLAVIDALPRYELIAIDTAPTGHALRLLQLVPKAREWLHVLLQILLKYRRVVGLGPLAKDLTESARQLRELEGLLHDPRRARFVLVTRASALPRLETERLLRELGGLGVAVPAILVNALTPPGCARCERAAAAERRELDRLLRARRGQASGCAMLGAPALAQAPRGRRALLEFGKTWTRIA
jgi:arsenite-transporting ATPase